MENENIEKTLAEENKKEFTQEDFAEVEEKFKKYSQVEDIFHKGLIGVFEDGKYIIDVDVKEELKILNKVIDSKDNKKLVCHAKYHDFLFNFVIEFEKQAIYSTAKLYLIEEREDDIEVKKFKTLISSEVVPENVDIEKRVMEAWHIHTEETPNEAKLSELDSIIIKLSKDKIFGRDLIEVLSQIYFFQMRKLLESLGENGKAVIKEYNELIRLVSIKKPSIVNNFSKQKALFEKVLVDSGIMEILKKEHAEELANIYKEFYEPLEKISIKKEKSVEVTKEPKVTDSVEIGGKPAKPATKGGKSEKGEKVTYFNPAKPGKVSPFDKYKANEGAGVAKIKPTEIKKPKVEAKKDAPQVPKPVEKPKPEITKKPEGFVNELGDMFDDVLQAEPEEQLSQTFDNALKNEGKEQLGDNMDNTLNDGVLRKKTKEKKNKYLDL